MKFTRSPSLAEVLRTAIDSHLAELRVALPAKVENFNRDKQLVDVIPLLKENAIDSNGIETEPFALPPIVDVPVVFPGAGDFRLVFDIPKGSPVLLVFSDRSLDRWLTNGDTVDPADLRRHHLSDAIAIPGLNPTARAWKAEADTMVIGHQGGGQIKIKQGQIRLLGDGSDTDAEKVVLASSKMLPHTHSIDFTFEAPSAGTFKGTLTSTDAVVKVDPDTCSSHVLATK